LIDHFASLLQPSVISLGLSALILGVVIFAQSRRWIEKVDLLIAGITLAIIFPASLARWTYNPGGSILGNGCWVSSDALALFRLIYKLLTLMF